MITVLPVLDKSELTEIYKEYNLPLSGNSAATVARHGAQVLGACLFEITNEDITITELVPLDDIMLADGILRSALHIANYRGINKAFFNNDNLTNVLNKLDFIKNANEKSLKIEKLHQSSCNCEKNNK